jgi:DNA processing protein
VVKLLKPGQSDYSRLLSKINDPPDPLYYLGNLNPLIFKNCLAVVGSRKMSGYGQQVVEKILPGVVEAGVTIVSGFIYGIDETAHRVCLENEGKTIAVLGCGIDLIRPTALKNLHQKILENDGLIVSELEGAHPPFRWTFVRRNRIISGLSKAVLVVEAGEESGSLVTANLARQQKRKVLAIPGPIGSSGSKGTAQLIRQGAILVTSAEEILTVLKIKPANKKEKIFNNLTDEEKQLMDFIGENCLTIDEICQDLKVSPSRLGSSLSILLIKGLLKQDSRGRYYLI